MKPLSCSSVAQPAKSVTKTSQKSLRGRINRGEVQGLFRDEPAGNVDHRSIQCAKRGTAEQRHRAEKIGAKYFDRARHTFFSGCRESVAVSATDRLHDVAAAADSAIHQHFSAIANGAHHLWQHLNRRRNPVKLASAVVRYD